MAALFNSPLVISGAAASRRASVLAAPRVNRRRSIHLAARAVVATAGEIAFFLWMLLPVAFVLLVVTGFFS
jgi:hypothetical protein